jgi:hypothetical protein
LNKQNLNKDVRARERKKPAMPEYLIKTAKTEPALKGEWDTAPWSEANCIKLEHWVARSSEHHPEVNVKALWNSKGIFVFFKVNDKYVRSIRTDYQASVCQDSCVEFFVKPLSDKGYFNFEINCGGTMLLYYIEDSTIIPGRGFAKYEQVPSNLGKLVQIYHSLPQIVYPELPFEVTWKLEYFIPFALFEQYLGKLNVAPGTEWRGNFYKCADGTSHPHWASWSSLEGNASFHLPQYFGVLKFS